MTNIGVFDSGVGGLWILKHLQDELPNYNYIFFGDQEHVPYGSRSLEEIQKFSEEITKFLIDRGCKLIVVACNTASAASLKYLREKFPEILFVGMEPAVKPAVLNTHTGRVGVLATPATFQGELYNSVVERFAHDVKIFQNTCPGLVEEIEKGELDSLETKKILKDALEPMLKENIDTVVLGCTHYPFVIPQIKEIVGAKVEVIDPTPAIVRQAGKLLNENGLMGDSNDKGSVQIFSSGNREETIHELFNKNTKVMKITWGDNLELNVLE